jgi:uncharacterized damage-inducible protein DinB
MASPTTRQRVTPSASPASVVGVIKHVAVTERHWVDTVEQRDSRREDYEAGFQLGPDETLGDVLDFYDEVAQETEAVVAEIPDLGRAVPVLQGVP